MIYLILPYPPSNNRYYRHGNGRTYIGEEGEIYRLEVLARRPRTGWPLPGRLRVEIDVFPKKGPTIDLDNIPKAVLDALQHAKIFPNDSAIDDLRIRRHGKVEIPYLRVMLAEIPV